jgi:hypothetical protein
MDVIINIVFFIPYNIGCLHGKPPTERFPMHSMEVQLSMEVLVYNWCIMSHFGWLTRG